VDYIYVYGNNIELYQSLIDKIKSLPEAQQRQYIQEFILRLEALDPEFMGQKFNIHVPGMIQFLTLVLQGEYDIGTPDGSMPNEHGSSI